MYPFDNLTCPDCGCVWVPAAKVLINDNQHQLWAVPWERAQCSWCCPPSEARTHVGTAHHVTAPGFWSLVQLETQVDEVFKSRRSLLLYHGHLLVPTSTDLLPFRFLNVKALLVAFNLEKIPAIRDSETSNFIRYQL